MIQQIIQKRANQGGNTMAYLTMAYLTMAKRAVCASLMILALVCGLTLTASAQTLADFGHGRLKVNEKSATEPRSLLVIRVSEPAGTPFDASHSESHYESMVFTGITTPNGVLSVSG